jgi:hypothetical protein
VLYFLAKCCSPGGQDPVADSSLIGRFALGRNGDETRRR